MQAAWYERNGAAVDVLRVGELPDPQPGPHEVRVRLRTAAINPSDVKARGGSRPVLPPRVGMWFLRLRSLAQGARRPMCTAN